MIIEFNGKKPEIKNSVYIAPGANVIGDVQIGENSSVWFGAVIRGDESNITIGDNSNVQDNAVIHSDKGEPVIIGNNVTIGHNAVIHSCEIKDNTVIGMGAVVLNGAVVSQGAVVAAGAVVKGNTIIPEKTLFAGAPAIEKKVFDDNIIIKNKKNADEYVRLSEIYSRRNLK